ncbi:copper homeostasis protein CutC [Spongiivirga citrea]|uniref:PF03932 family protein CutC n=1 Tax=Spongiivirga citrea TaxID=1481457 RepID=A0A6M0CJR1_9FLAO|nr:copper homeostasis protein CutC [Spongiivirga citrea]NER18081.1 copper homeostasis protein CutC [Spongiivirga citrea]
MIVEICTSNYQSAINAELAGANRIELCAELAVGGITPSHGLIEQVLQDIAIPVHVLIRPRSGDFFYSDGEFEIIKKDIQFCKEIGCAGVVIGMLNKDFTIDVERIRQLVALARPVHITFHRAFDWVSDQKTALEKLIGLGVDSVLTSGKKTSAELGIENLIELKEIAGNRINIIPGGGINASNASMFKENIFDQIHFSGMLIQDDQHPEKLSMNSPQLLRNEHVAISDIERIRSVLAVLRK